MRALAFSTSSPWTSVAALEGGGGIIWSGALHSPRNASGACCTLLEELRRSTQLGPADFDLFLADVGPGSFTGVRVGVVMAKSFAWIHGRPIAGADAFDLIAREGVAVLPSRKGEYFVRAPGEVPHRQRGLPSDAIGYGPDLEVNTPPAAAAFAPFWERLLTLDALTFAPEYLMEPSISTPKRAFPNV